MKKLVRLVPQWLLLHLFRVTEVRSEQERRMFHGLWARVWTAEEGRGSTFSFTLPTHANESECWANLN